MIIKYEKNLCDFDFWSGADDNAEMLTFDELQKIEKELEEIYPHGIDETELNDLFRFEFGWICSLIGLEYDEIHDEIIRN